MMRIDCPAVDPGIPDVMHDHRCCLEPAHDTDWHLCHDCRHTWPNHEYRLTEAGAA